MRLKIRRQIFFNVSGLMWVSSGGLPPTRDASASKNHNTSTSLPRAVKNKYVKTVQISFQNSIIFTFVPLKVTGIEACYKFCLILKVSIFLSVIYLLSLMKSESEQINLR